MKRTLCILLSLVLALTGFIGLGVTVSAYNVGDVIEFGSYPQTRITNTSLTETLNGKAAGKTWLDLEFYSGTGVYGSANNDRTGFYLDVLYNGSKYRGVKFTAYRPPLSNNYNSEEYAPDNTFTQYNNGYRINSIYWFKFEPLQWTVLDPSTGLLLCKTVIDSRPFNDVMDRSESNHEYYNQNNTFLYYSSDYSHSSLRDWLNSTFLDTAFSSAEQGKIEKTLLENKEINTLQGGTAYPHLDSDNTNDQIFLPCFSDVVNTAYGFNESTAYADPRRTCAATDYSKCIGVWVNGDGNAKWWLRTAGTDSNLALKVNFDGTAPYMDTAPTNSNRMGVCPALRCSDVVPASVEVVHVTVTKQGEGFAYGGGTFSKGTLVTVQANPNLLSVFDGWYEDGARVSTDQKYSFIVTKDTTLKANFRIVKAKLTLSTVGKGSVSGGGTYQIATPVQINASPASGWHFIGWYNGETLVSSDTSYKYPLFTDTTLTAKFEKGTSDNPIQNAKLNVPQSQAVGYKSTVTVIAKAENLPEGCFVALYEGESLLAKGDNKTVSYTEPKMKEGKTLTAKVIDVNGSVQSDADGKLEKEFTITVKAGFFDKLKAFFLGLFGLLPKVTLNP